MGWLSSAWSALKHVGGAVLGVVGRVAATVVAEAKIFINDVVTGYSEGRRAKPETEQEHAERALESVNDEIMKLRQRYRDNRGLTDSENTRWQELKKRRVELNDVITEVDKLHTAKCIVGQEKDYRSLLVNDASAHVLQYHVGKSTYNKVCRCGRPMVLQWSLKNGSERLDNFFWGCSGYYLLRGQMHACTRIEPLTPADRSLFVNMNRPEFELDAATLTKEAINPTKAKKLRQALDSIQQSHKEKRAGIATYRCPFHGESMRLQRKNEHVDQLFDQYFLGCPRWLPDKSGCNFLIKLKSAAQVSSVLDTEQRQGVLGV
jgi:hypothetical protein